MKHVIQKRKKRFGAVLLAALLLVSQMGPIAANAADYTVSESELPGKVVQAEDTLTYSTEREGTYTVNYCDADLNPIYEDTASDNDAYTVLAYSGISEAPALPETAVFEGWYVYSVYDSGGVQSVTLNARIRYPITYIGTDGATNNNPASYIYGDGVESLEDASKPGYTFDGWFSDSEYKTNVTYIDNETEGAVILYAKFIINEYTITFDPGNGSEKTMITQEFGTDITAPEDPTREGYTFEGWYPEVPEAMPGENMTITAQWTENSYPIHYELNGGEHVDNPDSYTYGSGVLRFEDAYKAGYTFDGWYSDAEFTTKVESVGENKTGEITLYAKFTQNPSYVITYVLNGGTNGNNPDSYIQGIGTALADAFKEGHTFSGWYSDAEFTNSVTSVDASRAGEITLYAKFTINQYTITFDTAGGNAVDPITQDYGTAVTAPANPTKTGYTFASWDKTIPATMPAEDMTITAQWNVNQYSITFDVDGGSEIASITQDYGTTVTAPANPTKTGYTFAGWDQTIPTTMPAENIIITARWTADSYSIRYVLDGGINGDNPGSYTYGSGVSGFADAAKLGCSFVGWYESADFSGNPVTSVAADRTGDLVLYAKFEMITIVAGTYSLTAGVEYKLGDVTKVSGDNSVYTPGSTFYVPVSGYYTFS